MADDSIQYCDDDTLEDPIDLSSSNISNENTSKLALNEANILNPEAERPSFILGSGSDHNVDTIASNNSTHFSNIRKLTDALNQNTDTSNNKLKTHFKLKRTMSPEFPLNQGNIKPDADNVVSRPFPIQRAASDIHNDHLRVPQAVSTSRLNNINLQTSTPMVANAASKDDFNTINKKSIQNLNSNNTSDDSNIDSSLNLKIKKHQAVIKLPSESQIITNNNNSVNVANNDNNQGSMITNINSNTSNSLQTPRIKNLSSMNKTDYFAAKLADATLEKTNRQDDQEENFVYEDLMLDNDKGNNGVTSQPSKTANNDNDDTKSNDEKVSAKQSSKSVINGSQVPSGKNLTNQPSVIIDPTRLMINNQKSISSMSTSINEKLGDHKMKNESTPILSGSEEPNQKTSMETNLHSFNNTNKASNLSSISNRPGNLLNNRNNIISHNGLLKNDEDNNITTSSITPDAPQQFLRPSMMNLSTASSNNNLSQYKKMMQNNARHSSVTVGVLPQNRSLLKNNSLISRNSEGVTPIAPSPSLNPNDLNSGYSAGTYNDILDYSSPTRNKTLSDQLGHQSPGNRKFRNKSNRNSVIQEENTDAGSYNQSSILPDFNNGNFLSLHDLDKQKLNFDGGNLQETEISSKYSSNLLPVLPFENATTGHRAKVSRKSSLIDENNDLKRHTKNDLDYNHVSTHKNGDETIFIDGDADESSDLNVEDEGNLLSSNFNNHLKKIMSGSKQGSADLKNEHISENGNIINNKSNRLSSKASNPQSDHYSTQSVLTMTTTDQQKRLSNGDNNFFNGSQRTKLKHAHKKSQSTHKGGNEVDMDEFDNSSKKSNPSLNSPIEMVSKKTSIKPGLFDAASGRHSNAINNFSNMHHFGLDDDYDEEDFDERSSFYYRYPPRRNSTNMSKTMTYTSTAASNFGRKMRSNKGLSYDDRKVFSNQLLSPGFEDMDTDCIKEVYFGDSQKLKSKKTLQNDATLTDEGNKFKDPGSQYTWGNNDMSYNDISDHQNFIDQGKTENGSEFMSLAVNDETERLHDDGKNFFYYDSIHDFYPNKDGITDKKNPKNMDFNQYTEFYSPHDYYANKNKNMAPMYMAKYTDSSKKPKTLWERVKRFLLLLFWTLALIMIGVGLGALLVSSTELQEFSVLDMYNGIVTQDEIIFDMSCIAHNPTLFNVYVEKSNLDIFAESEYLTGGNDENDGDDESRETILLGSVYGFETEMVFKTGIFWRHFDIARTSIKLKNPGMTDELLVANNQVLEDPNVSDRKVRTTLQPTATSVSIETLPSRKDTKLKKWKDICKYEFTLIVKGVAYYEAPMRKGQKSLPVQYQVVVNKGKHKI